MELERRYSVLAVSASLKFVETLRTLLPEGRCCRRGATAR